MSRADVLIVGGGIAGLCAAHFAKRAGRDVTLVDEGVQRASDLPIALINPLRGHTGRLVVRGVDGMHATFALIDALRDAGHAIAAGQGLFRPLIDVGAAAPRHADWFERSTGRTTRPRRSGWSTTCRALHPRDAGRVAAPDLLAAFSGDVVDKKAPVYDFQK